MVAKTFDWLIRLRMGWITSHAWKNISLIFVAIQNSYGCAKTFDWLVRLRMGWITSHAWKNISLIFGVIRNSYGC